VDDLPSYRAAMEWALEADPSTALGLASRLGQILDTRGSIVEGRLWVERALAVGHDAPPGELVQALAAAGTLSRIQGDLPASRGHHERQLQVAKEIGDEKLVAGSLSALGNVLLLQGEARAATEAFRTSYDMRVEQGDEVGIMRSLNNLGVLAGMAGDHEEAERCYVELIDRARTTGDSRVIGQTLHNLADLLATANRLDEATAHIDEALGHLEVVGDRRSLGISHGLRAALARRAGQFDDALRFGLVAIDYLAGVGDPVGVALVVDGVAATLTEQNRSDLDEAALQLLAATALLRGGEAERGLTEADCGELARDALKRRLGAAAYERAASQAGSAVDLEALLEQAAAAAKAGRAGAESGQAGAESAG
ncbi:MAG: tetratricopeptide repeat protein, partial [Acidimicrobiales bacterium]